MKKILYLFAVMTMIMSSCQKYDDEINQVNNRVDNLESRVDALEELCKQMNTNISSLQTLVKALQQNDYVTGVAPITKNGEVVGYTISFTKSEPITIYHGKNGEDGTNGSDGVDGHTPQIGVKEDSDGIYYWTVDGEWLLDDSGNKVKAVGIDGKDGENGGKDGEDGIDGITPQLKIENNYWYISYDQGQTWTQLGQATGDKGDTGLVGDSMFTDVDYYNGDYVIFTLSNGVQIKIPTWYAFEQLQTLCNQMNTNIASLQTIVGALQNNDYVQSITPLMENGKEVGYTITFTKSGAVTIYHGKDGANGNDGQNGTNGVDGKDGHTPQIGVKQDTDSIYYWTVDGEWLLDDNGNKIKAVGIDGKDGQDGTNGNDGQNGADGSNGTDGIDGITPELKIDGGYWYVSYDDGATWKQLGKATGEDGQNGADGTDGTNGKDGDSFFQSVDNSNSDYVVITLADGTEIKLPTWYAFEQLQKLCNQMNTNIASLQTIIGALQNNDYVQSITPLMENGKEVGYTITFTKSGAVTIYHGKDGVNGANGNDGQNGTNGTNGKDGHTPQIGVKQDTDGIYYWTVDGEWLLDDSGNKIKAVGTDGKDGQDGANGNNGNNGQDGVDGTNGTNGTDGITPELKIEDGYWYVSYDEGATWKQLGKATGEDGQDGTNGTDGKDGQDGDSFFQSVTEDEYNVYITLADGSVFTLPKTSSYLFNRLQSITFIPKYSDGKVPVTKNVNIKEGTSDNGVAEFDFQISPKEAVKDVAANWQTILSMKAIYTQTRAASFIDMPILSCEADETNGIISITVSGENMSKYFYYEEQPAMASIYLSDGNKSINSDFIEIVPDVPAYCEIIVSGALAGRVNTSDEAYNVKVISTTFNEDGALVIKFDGQIHYIYDYLTRTFTTNEFTITSIVIPPSIKSIRASLGPLGTGVNVYIEDLERWCEMSINYYGLESPLDNDGLLYLKGEQVTDLIIPETITEIKSYAFRGCKSIKSLTMHNNIKSIGYQAFYDCTNLKKVYCNAVKPPVYNTNAFFYYAYPYTSDRIIPCSIYVPIESVDAYKAASGWSDHKSNIVGNE